MSIQQLRVYGDFNCPWSYLASRRVDLLAGAGVAVDWRAVEHEPGSDPRDASERKQRVATVQEAMERINGMLVPGELLPYSLAGFVPDTGEALVAYAEACSAGLADAARQTLFEAFWCHAVDLDDEALVRSVLTDRLGDRRPSDLTAERPAATALVARWRSEWDQLDDETIPVVIPEGGEPVFGVDAVTLLAEEIDRRGLTFTG